jgi:hypothetical protein
VNEDRRKTALVIGAIAGAAGLVFGAWLLARRYGGGDAEDARSVANVLTDCYDKMREIQSHLTELAPVLGAPLPEGA